MGGAQRRKADSAGAEAYDYVIVGAGSAGCVLANRLSADGLNRVCLIEAGPADTHPFIAIPAGVAGLVNNPEVGWGYRTTPQANAANRSIPLPRGRVLGGCSSINGMVYFRGHPRDYDAWAADGNAGWSHADVLPYFRLSEANDTFRDPDHHGVDGPMAVSSYADCNPLIARFLAAAESLRFARCEDFNGQEPEGFGVRQATIKNGRRVSGVTAFLGPARARGNLDILTDTLVTRILFDGAKACGVEVERAGRREPILARSEVVVSAGAYGSPALLQRSGVGDGDKLARLGIPVIRNLPGVGANLQEHAAVPVQVTTRNTDSYGVSPRVLPRLAWNLLEYLLFRRGLLASNLFEATGFVRSTAGLDRPDLQLICIPANRNTSKLPIPIGHGYGFLSVLLRPKSRGAVDLASSDPHAPPLIDLNLFGEEEDLLPLVEGVRLSRRLFGSAAFDELDGTEVLPGRDVQSEADLIAFIRQTCVTVPHPVGTCRMGTSGTSVVGPDLRVHGLSRLRVVDASIMPTLIGGNTAAPVVMIAERAADLILHRPPLAAAADGFTSSHSCKMDAENV